MAEPAAPYRSSPISRWREASSWYGRTQQGRVRAVARIGGTVGRVGAYLASRLATVPAGAWVLTALLAAVWAVAVWKIVKLMPQRFPLE